MDCQTRGAATDPLPHGRTVFPGASAYSMTKAALTGLVRGAAIDLAPRTITVNNIQPGPTALT